MSTSTPFDATLTTTHEAEDMSWGGHIHPDLQLKSMEISPEHLDLAKRCLAIATFRKDSTVKVREVLSAMTVIFGADVVEKLRCDLLQDLIGPNA